jgi:glutamate-ammonia-ligase adenylyltransferase
MMVSATHTQVETAIARLPEILRSHASRWFERLSEMLDKDGVSYDLPDDLVSQLTKVVACSEFAGKIALREWSWLVTHLDMLQDPPDITALRESAQDLALADRSIDEVQHGLRQYRNRFMLHVLWREISALASLSESLLSLSSLADELVDAAARYAQLQMIDRFGLVHDADGDPVSIVILGMGKLGGKELNFSSDIDLIFLYPGGDASNGNMSLSAQEYFTRVSRKIFALLDEPTADGFVFRVDTRLRPFGDSGPQVVSFAALESYLLQHGRGWERYAYVKARVIGSLASAAVTSDLYGNLILPFVYRRYLDFGVFESLREMHSLIAAEVKRRELANNIKLGPGGIREIEFIVQSLQLVRGGSDPQLQGRELQIVLPQLVGRRGLSEDAVVKLNTAYGFLRRLENFIQGIRDQSTHDLPDDETDRARLCLAMGYSDWQALSAVLVEHRRNVAQLFDEIAFRGHEEDVGHGQRDGLRNLWDGDAAEDQWIEYLHSQEYSGAENIAKSIVAFRGAPSTRNIDSAGQERLATFVPILLVLLKDIDEPLLALNRTLAIVEKVLRRSAYLALLNENQQALSRMVSLCGRSAYIAEQIARYPVLLDELLEPRFVSARPTRAGFEERLQQRLLPIGDSDSEAIIEQLGQFQRANMFHIAVADFNGYLPIMKVSDALTELAEIVLETALRVAWQDTVNKHGVPQYVWEGEIHDAGFGVIAYGKLGGLELSYRSDLDLVFLHDSRGTKQNTNGPKPLENTMFFARLVRRLVLFLTTQTGSGLLYEIDTRLRPDGHSGLLVTSTEAFERYQIENAWTWEHQALLRARPVAGSSAIAGEFSRVREETLTQRVRQDTLQHDVASMRRRMRKELDKSSASTFDLKQGRGGIGDIEFIVQYLVLKCAHRHPDVIEYSDNIRQLDALTAAEAIDAQDAAQLQDAYRKFRLRLHRFALNDKPGLLDASKFLTERELVGAIWDTMFGETNDT